MKLLVPFTALILLISACSTNTPAPPSENLETDLNLIQFVNPLIGTQNMGHTFPGATAPFGMVQLSPETNQQPLFIDGAYNPETYRYCSGYQYDDSTIFGFSHTHFSGTGHSDLGDFLVMPTTGKLQLEPGKASEPYSGYHSKFSHLSEHTEPGYYTCELEDYGIKAELTSTERVGFHQYTFPQSDSAHILLDLRSNIYNYDGKNVWTFVRVENDTLVSGYRQTNGWARTKKVFFAMTFSQPIVSYGHQKDDDVKYNGFYRRFNEKENFPEMAGKELCAYFNFNTKDNQKLKMKFALSCVSTEGALKNLVAEIPHWEFEKTKEQTQLKWEKELQKIQVETITPEDKTVFYTALYHTMLGPILYEDVDGKYRGLDQNIHVSEGFTNYTIFSLWDTYRALHPLFNIIQPERNNDMMHSMLAHHDQSVHSMLPIWSHYANENWCMIGYHSVSALADAVVKGATDVDTQRALEACVNTSNVGYFDGIADYKLLGYVPEDKSSSSVSKTLEFAYDDWCIAQIAAAAGNDSIASIYLQRATNYENVYDPVIGFMRPKLSSGEWRAEFDPLDTHGQGFIEGNALNYGLYVPQNIPHMIEMMGGKEKFVGDLDRIFETEVEDKYIENTEDITRDGIIGNYVHGNEPGHHIPYLYNWTSEPWKTAQRVRTITSTMYGPGPDGLCGNDDAGQMSAWYVFSALGFYPVLPGSVEYAVGSPTVKSAHVQLPQGKVLSILVEGQSTENIYVHKIELNGVQIEGNLLKHSELMSGGKLTYYMSSDPPSQSTEVSGE